MKLNKIEGYLVLLIMIASAVLVPFSASAAGTVYSSTLATEESKKIVTLDSYLVMYANASVPNSSFTFTVTPGAAIAADSGKFAVFAGVGEPTLTNGTMTFSTSDTTIPKASVGSDTPVFLEQDNIDEKYVKKILTLNFSNVTFSEPGIYRYIITEYGNNRGITNGYITSELTETKRTLDVYVINAGTTDTDGKPQLKIENYLMYNGTQIAAPTFDGSAVANATKNATITNVYASQNLTFGNIVTGNQGSKDKYFDFTVTISNVAPGSVYAVDLTKADATSGTNAATIEANQGKTNANTITVPAATEGESTSSITTHFYLQNGQYITIQGLARNAKYKITENAENYISKNGIDANLSTLDWSGNQVNDALSDAVEGTIAFADVHTGFTNTRDGVIPTGVFSAVVRAMGLIVMGIIGVGCGMIYIKTNKLEEE